MFNDHSTLWWNDITGPANLVREIVICLQESKPLVLDVPEDLPWRKQMRSSVESQLRENDPDLFITYVDCKSEPLDSGNIPEYILERFAYPEIKSGYRASSGISIYQYILQNEVLKNRIIWVKGMNRQQIIDWLNFCKKYQSKVCNNGMIVLETYEIALLGIGVINTRQLQYSDYVSYYDALLFNSILVSAVTSCSMECGQYIATAASLLCNWDVELSEAVISHINLVNLDLIDLLLKISSSPDFKLRAQAEHLDAQHPFSRIRNQQSEDMQKQIWKAQLQVLFPLLELERIAFIDRYGAMIEAALEIPYWDKKRGLPQQITQFGETVLSKYDVEIGTLHRMNHLRQAKDQSLYLLFLPSEEDRGRLALLYNMRNAIAHMETCPVDQVKQFFLQYPYHWKCMCDDIESHE